MYNNELIAEFMNLKSKKSWATLWMPSDDLNNLNHIIHNEMKDETWFVTSLRFDESWDWMHPVIAKCINLEDTDFPFFDNEDKHQVFLGNLPWIYEKVVEFIKKYNEKSN